MGAEPKKTSKYKKIITPVWAGSDFGENESKMASLELSSFNFFSTKLQQGFGNMSRNFVFRISKNWSN